MSDFLPTDFEPIDEDSANVLQRLKVKKKLAVLTVGTIVMTMGAAVLSSSDMLSTPQLDQQQLLLQNLCVVECYDCFTPGSPSNSWQNIEKYCQTDCRDCIAGCGLPGISASDSNKIDNKGFAAGWNYVNMGGTYLNMHPCNEEK
mmetsp:Transcript_29015/g.29467  ORF Transcript_29015/g.29467 Transcript_29015/m.29467 type:complete len:145 (-) Transcript_29015:73-507(-)